QGGRPVLLDIADAQAARAYYLTHVGIGMAGKAAQQRGLTAAVASDKADPVRIADGEAEVLEQWVRRQYAHIAQADRRHRFVFRLERTRKRSEPTRRQRQVGPLASPATTGRRANTGPRG